MPELKSNEPLYKLHFSELAEDAVNVLAFEGEESISRLFEYRLQLVSGDPALDAKKILNKKATFTLTRGDEEPVKLHGIISQFEQRGQNPEYVSYYAVLVPKLWRLTLNFSSNVFQKVDVEALVTEVLKTAGLAGSDYEFKLNESYPQRDYTVQYRETDFDFINRQLEHYGIYYYFDHRDDNDVVVFTDSIDNLPAVASEAAMIYNPNKDPLSEYETITELSCQEKVVTGKVKLKDYNYEFPNKNLNAETQLDPEAPGLFYDYGDHFKDESEGELLAQVRNEEIYCGNKIYYGKSDSRLFRAGFKYKLDKHYRSDWNAEFILTRVKSHGNQGGMFVVLEGKKKRLPTFENEFEAIPADRAYRPPRRTPIPRLSGIMTAKVESGAGDEYAFIDDHGRYKMKVPFDLSDKTNGEASRTIRLAQPYSGAGYGMHFPNHADTEIVWACVDGNVDRPIGLSTVPNPSNASPSTGGNKAQSVIRTAGQNELTLDDTTGSENIYLHGTKDWTIDIVNDKKQTVGHDETASVGNDRSRSVGNDETVSVGNNRSKNVGADQVEKIGKNNTLDVGVDFKESIGANHQETVGGSKKENVGGSMMQKIARAKVENVGLTKMLNIGGAYQVTVGAVMNETVTLARAEQVGMMKTTMVGMNSMEKIGKTKTINAGKKIELVCGKGKIVIEESGKILIEGTELTLKATGGNVTINGEIVDIN